MSMGPMLLPLLVVLLAGCAGTSPTPRFYLLESVPTVPPAPLTQLPDLALGVGPLTLPDLLDRPQMLTHGGPHQVDVAEFHRWAGDLGANLSRVLAERLGARLGTERLSLYPWPAQRRLDYQVRAELWRFDGRPGGEAVLWGQWSLLDGAGERELRTQGVRLRESVNGGEFVDLAAALSRLSERLGDQIAQGLAEQVERDKGPR